jgi:membrane protease YdiL (CAAX protease family)
MPAAGPPKREPAPAPAPSLLRLALPFYGIVVVFAFGYALFSGGILALLVTLDPTRDPARLAAGLAGAVGIALALVVLTRVATRAWRPFGRMSESLTTLIGPISTRDAILLALVSGFAEELLFRGALFPHLGLLGTTLLFGLVHVLPRRHLWVYPFFATLAGLLLGLLRDGTASLWPPIVAHVAVNAINLAWIGRMARAKNAEAPTAE